MIRSLYIRNYLLIDELEMQFSEGFTTITGETGAGKSILMGALSLILGQRVDTSVLKLKEAKCIVEGTFEPGEELRELFAGHDLDYEKSSTLRREIAPGGKSRAFINDTPVNLTALRQVGNRLVDIHSQHQNLQLGDHQYQREVIDYLADTREELRDYRQAFEKFTGLGRELEETRDEIERLKEDLDFMQFQHNELASAHLKEGELENLEAEQQRAAHAEEIKTALHDSAERLTGERTGILDQLKEVLSQFRKISEYYGPAGGELLTRLESAYIELKDLSREIEDQAEGAEGEPGRMAELQDRIDLLYSLMQKHRVPDPEGLIEMRDKLARRIEEVTFSDERIRLLEDERAACRSAMEKLSGILHRKRVSAGKEMQQQVEQQLRQLGIPHARFSVEVAKAGSFHAYGSDEIRFLFSANKQSPLEEISGVASGGEVSRLMLCIKSMVSDRKGMPTLIFDEIDAGVGGEIADRFGGIMEGLSAGRQVVAITHLPQVASRGSEHFIVYKEDTRDATYTRIRRLTSEERVEEIARMLSGESVTEAALTNARVLLKV